MKKIFTFLLSICFTWGSPILGQSDFVSDYLNTNPAMSNSCTFEEEVELHLEFLNNAIQNKDSLHQLYGYLYLADDYTGVQEYSKTTEYLLKAEKLALSSGNILWQGRVNHYKGSLYTDLFNYEEALRYFELSLSQNIVALDSQNMAMNLEQIGSMHIYSEEYEKAHQYYEKAIPLIKKFCSPMSLAVTLGNYGTLLNHEGRFEESIDYYKQALVILREIKSRYRESIHMNNLADSYLSLKKFDEALAIWQECVRINKENNWPDNLITNYSGISDVYEQKGDFEKALYYYQDYHMVYDSIVGVDVKKNIANLEAKYENEKKELALQKYELDLQQTQQSLERSVGLLIIMLLLILAGISLWRVQSKFARRSLMQSQENLGAITQLLVKKNAHIEALEQQIKASEKDAEFNINSNGRDSEESFYNQRILTPSDWELFKTNFEKSYPGYIHRLRSLYPTLSEAEERLFLLLKLHLSTKEIADMLGISTAGVKKTRYRLRKRIQIEEGISLDKHVQVF